MAGVAGAIWLAGNAVVPKANDGIEHVLRQMLLVGVPVVIGGAFYLVVVSRIATREVGELRMAVTRRLGRLGHR